MPPEPSKPKTNARKIVEKIEAYLAGEADISTASYTITGASGGSRQLSRCTHSELLGLLKYWRHRLAQEERNAAGTDLQHIAYNL